MNDKNNIKIPHKLACANPWKLIEYYKWYWIVIGYWFIDIDGFYFRIYKKFFGDRDSLDGYDQTDGFDDIKSCMKEARKNVRQMIRDNTF